MRPLTPYQLEVADALISRGLPFETVAKALKVSVHFLVSQRSAVTQCRAHLNDLIREYGSMPVAQNYSPRHIFYA